MEKLILVLSHEFPPLGGGAGRNLLGVCDELAKQGVKLCVWTLASPERRTQKHGFSIKEFSTTRVKRFQTSIASMFNFIVRVLFAGLFARRDRPVIVFSNMAIPAGIAGSVLSARYKVPHVIWHHGSDVHGGKPGGPSGIQRMILRKVWRSSSLCLFISRSLKQCAERIGAVPRADVLPVALAIPNSKRLKTSVTKKTFLFAGRMEPVKNPLLFVEAVRLFACRGGRPDVEFVLVGSGRLSGRVEDAIMSGVGLSSLLSLRSEVPQEELFTLFETCYAYVMPSRAEGFPTTVIEAAMFGVPSIGSKTLGIEECILDGKTGLLFSEGDALSLCRAMESLAMDTDLQKRLGEGARSNAQLYTAEKTAEKFLSCITPLFDK
jgi:glycosyltransferase involved in cell wall biosynthesis